MNSLIKLIKKLRNPNEGCAWDCKQTENSIKNYIIEEAYELKEAIDKQSPVLQKEEAGDLLLQILLLSRIHEEQGTFSFSDVVLSLKEKIINRHPHIFIDKQDLTDDQVSTQWEQIKKENKSSKSIISDYPKEMPALLISKRISEQAATIGFDWESPFAALNKVKEETVELEHEINKNDSLKIEEELGDLLLSVANVARKLKINPEEALIKANKKFINRFRNLENNLENSHEKYSIDQLEKLWIELKKIN